MPAEPPRECGEAIARRSPKALILSGMWQRPFVLEHLAEIAASNRCVRFATTVASDAAWASAPPQRCRTCCLRAGFGSSPPMRTAVQFDLPATRAEPFNQANGVRNVSFMRQAPKNETAAAAMIR